MVVIGIFGFLSDQPVTTRKNCAEPVQRSIDQQPAARCKGADLPQPEAPICRSIRPSSRADWRRAAPRWRGHPGHKSFPTFFISKIGTAPSAIGLGSMPRACARSAAFERATSGDNLMCGMPITEQDGNQKDLRPLHRARRPKNFVDLYPHQLSGGMKQRVAIPARCLPTMLRSC